MSVTISYSGDINEFQQAVEQANEILQSEEFFALIASREIPFEESSPGNPSPILIADIFRKSNLSLTLKEYAADRTIGGRFQSHNPNVVWLNTNALHREFCKLSCVLVHECVHALSKDNKDYDFTHCTKEEHDRKDHENTAPYWIQAGLTAAYCPGFTEDETLLVELIDDSESE